jgi:hypothetical protein
VGAEELVATTEGLYIGSDTDRLGPNCGTTGGPSGCGEFHARLGMFPLV